MIAALGFGLLIGAVLGLLGAGGSILAIPALVYGVGEPVRQAIPASLLVVGLSALGGIVARLGQHLVRWPVAAVFGGAGIATAFAGSAVGRLVSPQVLLLAFAALMIAAAAAMLAERADPHGLCAGSQGRVNWRACLPRALAVGALAGFLAGLFGVGGGFVVVPALVLLLGLAVPDAIATSLVIVAINAAAGLIAHLDAARHLDLLVVAVFTATALSTAVAAGWAGRRLPADRLRRWFAYVVVAAAVFVAVQAIAKPAVWGGE